MASLHAGGVVASVLHSVNWIYKKDFSLCKHLDDLFKVWLAHAGYAVLQLGGKDVKTFGELAQEYLHSLEGKPSGARYRRLYLQVFAAQGWSKRSLQSITRYDVLLLQQSLAPTPAQAAKALGFLRQAYNYGRNTIDRQRRRPLYAGENPALGIRCARGTSRSRVMTEREIGLLLRGLPRLTPKYRAFYLCRILAPGRITELCRMRREHLSDTGRWVKPLTKNGTAQYTYLPTQAMQAVRAMGGSGEWVFAGHGGRPLTGMAVRKAWRSHARTLGIEGVQLLDFRRTLATYLYRQIKADDLLAKAVLNHYDGRPVAVYTRLDYDYLAGIIQRYADWVCSLGYHTEAVNTYVEARA